MFQYVYIKVATHEYMFLLSVIWLNTHQYVKPRSYDYTDNDNMCVVGQF